MSGSGIVMEVFFEISLSFVLVPIRLERYLRMRHFMPNQEATNLGDRAHRAAGE
jgi:hypothetical protein